jgi:hypothetical protein
MYKDDKISKEDVAKVLETSVFYVDWLLSQIKIKKDTTLAEDPSQILFDFSSIPEVTTTAP